MFCFSPSAVVSPALHSFLYRQWIETNDRNYSTPFLKWFSFFLTRKKLFEKNFSPRMCAKRRSVSCKKKWEFWRETHTPLWLLIGRIIFLTCEKTSFAILIGRIIFFTCENHSSLLWLARTHLRIKIYNTPFWWVFLSMYIINHHIISYHIVPDHIISYHIIYHIISYHNISQHIS